MKIFSKASLVLDIHPALSVRILGSNLSIDVFGNVILDNNSRLLVSLVQNCDMKEDAH